MTEVVIFDMDGTLVDTNRMTARAFAENAPGCGLPVPPENVIRDAIGLADLHFYREIYPGVSDERLRPLAALVEAREGELGRALGAEVLFPGVAEMLEGLHAAGKRVYLASTGTQRHVSDMLGAAGIEGMFREIHCAEPDKEAMTAQILRGEPGRGAAFVGDTLKDIRAGRANGIPVYGAGFGYVKPRERALFDAVFESPAALLRHLLAE